MLLVGLGLGIGSGFDWVDWELRPDHVQHGLGSPRASSAADGTCCLVRCCLSARRLTLLYLTVHALSRLGGKRLFPSQRIFYYITNIGELKISVAKGISHSLGDSCS